jgi:hypothetical protein
LPAAIRSGAFTPRCAIRRTAIDGATLAVACGEDYRGGAEMAGRSDHDGLARVGGLGTQFPLGCDVFVAKVGYRTHRIRYREICPNGPNDCIAWSASTSCSIQCRSQRCSSR